MGYNALFSDTAEPQLGKDTGYVIHFRSTRTLEERTTLKFSVEKNMAECFFEPPLSNDTINSVLRYREAGRAKDLPAPPRIYYILLYVSYIQRPSSGKNTVTENTYEDVHVKCGFCKWAEYTIKIKNYEKCNPPGLTSCGIKPNVYSDIY